MSTQAPAVPLGYAQDAIAPEKVTCIIMSADPDFERTITLADQVLEHQHYDLLAKEELEGILAGMQFPS